MQRPLCSGQAPSSALTSALQIDRDPTHFLAILAYLRDGSMSLPQDPRELEGLLREAHYYALTQLAEEVETALEKRREAQVGRHVCGAGAGRSWQGPASAWGRGQQGNVSCTPNGPTKVTAIR